VSPIIDGKKDSVGFVIGRDNDGADVAYSVFAKIFLIHADHVRWSGDVNLHMIIKGKTIDIPEIAGLTHTEDDGFCKTIKPAEHVPWGNVGEVPMPNGRFNRFEECVFANS
jgi:hypothetical protein